MNTEGIKLLKDTEKKDHFLFEEITQQAKDSKAIYGLIAFVTQSGFFTPIKENKNSLSECLLPLLKNENSKLIFSLLNDKNNIQRVVNFSKDCKISSFHFPKNQKVKIHDKVILFEKISGLFSVIIGSHNWTSYALHKEKSPFNSETSILLKELHKESDIVQTLLNYILEMDTLSIIEENKEVIIENNRERLKEFRSFYFNDNHKKQSPGETIRPEKKDKPFKIITLDKFELFRTNNVVLYLLIKIEIWEKLSSTNRNILLKNGNPINISTNKGIQELEIFFSQVNEKNKNSYFNQDLSQFTHFAIINEPKKGSRIIEFGILKSNEKFNLITQHKEWDNVGIQLGLRFINVKNNPKSHIESIDDPTISFITK